MTSSLDSVTVTVDITLVRRRQIEPMQMVDLLEYLKAKHPEYASGWKLGDRKTAMFSIVINDVEPSK